MAIGRAAWYYAQAAHAFSARIEGQHHIKHWFLPGAYRCAMVLAVLSGASMANFVLCHCGAARGGAC